MAILHRDRDAIELGRISGGWNCSIITLILCLGSRASRRQIPLRLRGLALVIMSGTTGCQPLLVGIHTWGQFYSVGHTLTSVYLPGMTRTELLIRVKRWKIGSAGSLNHKLVQKGCILCL